MERAARARHGRALDILDLLVEIAKGGGRAEQVAIAWVLGEPWMSSVMIGARTVEQLADNLAAAD